jgi:RNA polymerase sigma-70 factor (ECF subfamily)
VPRRGSNMMADMRLVERMLAGDEGSFQEFFAHFFPALYRFALARLDRDVDAAEDVVQATLCRAVDRLHTYRGEAALLTWLCTICRRQISDHWDRLRAKPQLCPIEDAPEIRAALESLGAAEADRPDAALDRQELSRLVHVALDSLPGRYGDALEWKYLQGLSVREIGERLAIGPKAAESLLHRARSAFRDGFQAVSRGLSSANRVLRDGLE